MNKFYLLWIFVLLVPLVNALVVTSPSIAQNFTENISSSWSNSSGNTYYKIFLINSTGTNTYFDSFNHFENLSMVNYTGFYSGIVKTIYMYNTTLFNITSKYWGYAGASGSSVGYIIAYMDGGTITASTSTTTNASVFDYAYTHANLSRKVHNISVTLTGDATGFYHYENETRINGVGYSNNYSRSYIDYNLPVGQYQVNITSFNSTDAPIESNVSSTFNLVANALLNVSVFSYNGSLVNFSANLSGGVNRVALYSSLFNVVNGSSYTLTVDSPGLASNTSSFSIGSFGTSARNYTLFPERAVNLSIFDYSTGNLITQNMTVVVTKSNASTYYTTSGKILLLNLATGINEIKVYNVNYSEARYYLNIVDDTYYTYSAYASPIGSFNNVTFTFYDVNGAFIENVFMEQFVVTNSTYVSTMSGYSSIVGKIYFTYDPDSYYIYNCSKSGYICSSFVLNPPRESNYDITLSSVSASINYSRLQVVGSASYNNNTNILSFAYSSNESSISRYNFTVFVGASRVCSNGSSAVSGSFTCNLTGEAGTAWVYGLADDKIFYGVPFDIPRFMLADYMDIEDAAILGAIFALIFIIVGALISIFGALVMAIVALLAIYWIGLFTVLSTMLITVMVVVSLIIAFVIRRRY